MKINMSETDANAVSGFYAVDHAVFCQTMSESKILHTFEMGGVTIHYGMRENRPAWLLDNPGGLYGIWLEDDSNLWAVGRSNARMCVSANNISENMAWSLAAPLERC